MSGGYEDAPAYGLALVITAVATGLAFGHIHHAKKHGVARKEPITFGGVEGFPRLDGVVDDLAGSEDGSAFATFASNTAVVVGRDPLRESARASEAGRITGIALSADGAMLAVALGDKGEVRVHDLRGFAAPRSIKVVDLARDHAPLAFSHDGARLAAGTDARRSPLEAHRGGVTVTRIASGKGELSFALAHGGPLALAWAGDAIVAVTGDRVDARVDVEIHGPSGQAVRAVPVPMQAGASGGTAAAELSSDGAVLAIASYLASDPARGLDHGFGAPLTRGLERPSVRATTRYFDVAAGAALPTATEGVHPFVEAGATLDLVHGELLARGAPRESTSVHGPLAVPHEAVCEVSRAAAGRDGSLAVLLGCPIPNELSLYTPTGLAPRRTFSLARCKVDHVALRGSVLYAFSNGCLFDSSKPKVERLAPPPAVDFMFGEAGTNAEAGEPKVRAVAAPDGAVRISNARGGGAWLHFVKGHVVALGDDGRIEVRGEGDGGGGGRGTGALTCRQGDRSLPFSACAEALRKEDVIDAILRGEGPVKSPGKL